MALMQRIKSNWQPLGRMLVEKGLLTEGELEGVLAEQRRTGRRLGEIIKERGFVSAPAIADVLAEQYGLELELERGFGSGLRSQIDVRHQAKRGLHPDVAPRETVNAERDRALTARLSGAAPSAEESHVAALEAELEDRERLVEELASANHRRMEEIDDLRVQLRERDALIELLRESGKDSTADEPLPPAPLRRITAA